MDNTAIDTAVLEALKQAGDTTKAQITRLQEQLAVIDTILTAPDTTYKYYVKTISLWTQEGEVEAEAHSKHLATAIKKAGERHHKLNERSDWQVQWEVKVAISGGGESMLLPLPPAVYRPLLPGGQSEVRLKIRSTRHLGRRGR